METNDLPFRKIRSGERCKSEIKEAERLYYAFGQYTNLFYISVCILYSVSGENVFGSKRPGLFQLVVL